MASSGDLRGIANDIIDLAIHKRQVERIREYGGTNSSSWPDEDVEGQYQYVLAEFEKFTAPDNSGFSQLVEHLVEARARVLSHDASFLGSDVVMKISDWQGDAKIAFDENYIAPWETYREYHCQLLDSLSSAATAHEVLYRQMRATAYEIGEAAKTALEGIDGFPIWLSEVEVGDIGLKVAGLITAAVAAPVTGGKSVAAGIMVVFADAALTSGRAVSSVEGEWVFQVLDSMCEQLRQLDKDTFAEEQEISGALRLNVDTISKHMVDLVPPIPELASVDPENPGDDLEPPAY